jgi:hypothetical protein
METNESFIVTLYILCAEHAVDLLIEALCYKPDVTGSIPDEVIGFFNTNNPSSRTMVLGSTHPLTEMKTRNIPGG